MPDSESADRTDRERLDDVTAALGGDENRLRDLTERHLGTRDLDEADRRTRVIWEWEEDDAR